MSVKPALRVLDWNGFEGAASFTFDDAQPSHIEYWPRLRATGVRSTWYLSPGFRQDSAFETTWRQAVADGHEIGGHTATHPHADGLDARLAAEELDGCDRYIRDELGQARVWTFAYPFGETAWKPFLNHRYLFARTVDDGLVRPGGTQDPLLLPSYLVQEGDGEAVFRQKLDAAADSRSWQILLFHSLTPTAHHWYAGVSADSVIGALEHGGRGRVWLDTVVNIGAYWLGARLLRAAAFREAGSWSWTLPAGFPEGRSVLVETNGVLFQDGRALGNDRGRFSVSLDAGHLEWRPETATRANPPR